MLEKTRTFQSYMSPQWLLAISPLEHWIAVSDNTLLVENLAIVHPNIAPSEFSSSDLEKCSLASLSQQWMLCSEWVPSEWESILWCFYQLFGLKFWRHPFTAEHPLLSQRCKATFLQIWWRNNLLRWPEDGDIFSKCLFCVNCSFNCGRFSSSQRIASSPSLEELS